MLLQKGENLEDDDELTRSEFPPRRNFNSATGPGYGDQSSSSVKKFPKKVVRFYQCLHGSARSNQIFVISFAITLFN